MKLSSFEIKRYILRKMARHKMWGGKHMAFENVLKGTPPESRKEVKKELEKLIREGIILTKPAHYGLQVSLNIQKKAEIEKIIQTE